VNTPCLHDYIHCQILCFLLLFSASESKFVLESQRSDPNLRYQGQRTKHCGFQAQNNDFLTLESLSSFSIFKIECGTTHSPIPVLFDAASCGQLPSSC
jgi:hypothetical protein